MTDASTLGIMSPGLLKVVERAQREPEGRFHLLLAHLIDVPAFERAFHRLRKEAVVGVEGVTKEAYGRELDANLADLHERLKTKRYRHQPLRRVHIPKDKGQAARTDILDYIERFYSRQRRHGSAGRMSPLNYEASALNQPVH